MEYLTTGADLVSVADAIRSRGGTSAPLAYPSGFVSAIAAIPAGGGSEPTEVKDVNFIDYDGTLLHSYTTAEAQALANLPPNPAHAGLTAQGWNWTLAQIRTQLTAMPGMPVWIGQLYVTASGKTEIGIELDDPAYLSPYLGVPVNGTVRVDWGDGSTEDMLTGTGSSTIRYKQHAYANTGKYTIQLTVSSGTMYFRSDSSNYPAILRVGSSGYRRYPRVYAYCIKSIRIGNNVSVIDNGLCACSSLESLTVPADAVISGNNIFQYDYALKSVTLPPGTTVLGNSLFFNNYALESVSLPPNVTEMKASAFSNCYGLKHVTVPSGATTFGNSVFHYCFSLESLTVPQGTTAVSDNLIDYCAAMKRITLPSTVTSIGTNAFSNDYSLRSISVRPGVVSFGNSAFYSCYNLTEVLIPSTVTSLGEQVFYACHSLRTLTVPSGVTSIGKSCFYNCYGMLEYHFQSTTPPALGATAFNGIVADTVIYVPAGSLAAYQTAPNWSTYAAYMQEEPAA